MPIHSQALFFLFGTGANGKSVTVDTISGKATGEGREAVTAAIFWLKTRARWKESPADVNISFITHEDALAQLE